MERGLRAASDHPERMYRLIGGRRYSMGLPARPQKPKRAEPFVHRSKTARFAEQLRAYLRGEAEALWAN